LLTIFENLNLQSDLYNNLSRKHGIFIAKQIYKLSRSISVRVAI
jgi:hypothetical protein